jgi:hypothetical protein
MQALNLDEQSPARSHLVWLQRVCDRLCRRWTITEPCNRTWQGG